MESIVGCFFIGKQKVVLFPKYMENGWETDESALNVLYWFYTKKRNSIYMLYLGLYKRGGYNRLTTDNYLSPLQL
jgi:hypothetical protein